MVFIPACARLGMVARNIVGTTVVAVTCATTAGSLAYTQVCVRTYRLRHTASRVASSRRLASLLFLDWAHVAAFPAFQHSTNSCVCLATSLSTRLASSSITPR